MSGKGLTFVSESSPAVLDAVQQLVEALAAERCQLGAIFIGNIDDQGRAFLFLSNVSAEARLAIFADMERVIPALRASILHPQQGGQA